MNFNILYILCENKITELNINDCTRIEILAVLKIGYLLILVVAIVTSICTEVVNFGDFTWDPIGNYDNNRFSKNLQFENTQLV